MKIRLLVLMIVVGCVNHDVGNPLKRMALERACSACGKTITQMFWFEELIDQTEQEVALKGDIYLGSLDGTVIFVHQPVVASCLACRIYDCDGNRLTLTWSQAELVISQMIESNRIYNAFAAD